MRAYAQLRAAFKEDPSSLSADDRARTEQLLARDARKAAKKAARRVSSETPSPPPAPDKMDRAAAILTDLQLESTGTLMGDLTAAAASIGVEPAETVIDTLARLEAVLTGTGSPK